jgi:predicted alpha/beta superfamily hydrolase
MNELLKKIYFLIIFTGICTAQNINSNVSRPVELAGTHVHHITSAIADQVYDLYVALPKNYSDTTRTFRVLYLVDGQWDFPLVNSIYGQQYYDGFVPDLVIVGITWGGDKPNYDQLRGRDLTPTSTPQQNPSGNAPKFLESIRKELIPFIESKYRVNKDRALWGSSYGGLFTLFAMLTETDLFSRYILTSPALYYDNQLLLKIEQSYFEKKKELNARLYMAMGSYEDTKLFQKFYDLLKERNYEGLKIGFKIIDGVGHSGGKAEGCSRGLQYAYERPELSLDKSVLEQYTGTYQVFAAMTIKITIENGGLVGTTWDNNKAYLYAETEKDFYVKGQFLRIHFVKDEAGKVTGFKMENYNQNFFIKKVD